MVKKKISGQTIAIIILAIMLLLAIGFGAVFAYFSTSSSSIQGTIVLANLNISLEVQNLEDIDGNTTTSESSEIIISGTNVLPNQKILNRPLVVNNTSNAPTYLMVAYKVGAVRSVQGGDDVIIRDDFDGCVIDLGIDYINSHHSSEFRHYDEYGALITDPTEDVRRHTKWVDYVFTYTDPNVPNAEPQIYRCLVLLEKQAASTGTPNKIEVIGRDQLKLHSDLDNDFQNSALSFTFQAYVIGASEDIIDTVESTVKNPDGSVATYPDGSPKYKYSTEERCLAIVENTFRTQNYKFLNVEVDE